MFNYSQNFTLLFVDVYDKAGSPIMLMEFPSCSNIYGTYYMGAAFPSSGELARVDYYAAQNGTFFLGIWRNLYAEVYQMIGKISITATQNGSHVCTHP